MGKREKVDEKIFSLQSKLLENLDHQEYKGILNTIDILKYSSIADKFLKLGDQAPDFLLPNAFGNWFSLKDEVKKGKAILVFIRGGWSPYCYIQLRKIQEKIEEFKAMNFGVFAITNEKPENCLQILKRNNLNYELLSDKGSRVADYYHLIYKSENNQLLTDLGIGAAINSGDISYQLPLPATYIIDEWMTIRYAFINPDYRIRPDIEEILKYARYVI